MLDRARSESIHWAGQLDLRDTLRATTIGGRSVIEHIARLVDIDVERVMIASQLRGHEAEALAAAHEAAAAAAALCVVNRGDVVFLKWPNGMRRHVQGDGAALAPAVWLQAVACALLARDDTVLGILCERVRVTAPYDPDDPAGAFWPFLCGAVARIIERSGHAAPWITEAEALLARESVYRANPDVIRLLVRPLVPMLRALATRDGDFNRALHMALDAHREYFLSRPDDDDSNALLALNVAGLAALAADRDRRFDLGELPEALVRGTVEGHPIKVSIKCGQAEDPSTVHVRDHPS